jgi:hypothetical protein
MTGLHGRPTASELVEAVQEFLEDLRLSNQPPNLFQLRVAINMLQIIKRELEAGEYPPASVRLGLTSEAELASQIRGGLLPEERRVAIIAELRADVEARLIVANPEYILQYEPDAFDDD